MMSAMVLRIDGRLGGRSIHHMRTLSHRLSWRTLATYSYQLTMTNVTHASHSVVEFALKSTV